MNQEQLCERAHERVEAIKGFYIHAAVYAMVNLGLFAINALTAFGSWWFYWPLIGWGIALTILRGLEHRPESTIAPALSLSPCERPILGIPAS